MVNYFKMLYMLKMMLYKMFIEVKFFTDFIDATIQFCLTEINVFFYVQI